MIQVVNVWQHYGVRPILQEINLLVPGGELVALMGPNGMGKSTLLSVMAGILSPQVGHVEINGLRRRSTAANELEIRRRTVYLPDHPWLPLERTGREFLLAVGRLYGVLEDRLMDHTDRLLRLFHLDKQGNAPIRSYSTGQKKKIAISSALVTDAPILLLDEPFSGGLDPSAILALKRVLLRLAERPDVTVVVATPIPQLMEEIAHRIALIQNGELIVYDTPEGLRKEAGTEGPLEEVLEKLLSPDTLDAIESYFEEGASWDSR